MSEKIIALLIGAIASGGYASVVLLMAIQSACIPIPSEVIMPLAGYALAHTQVQLIILATVASLASNLGSIPAYWVGAKGGRPMVERYGSMCSSAAATSTSSITSSPSTAPSPS